MVEILISQHDDLDVEGNRIGLESRRHHGQWSLRRADLELSGREGTLESFPNALLGQHILCVDDQETAIRAQQRSGADVHEVRLGLKSVFDRTLDGTEQPHQRRRVLENHRATLTPCVAEDHINLEGRQRIAGRLPARGLPVGAVARVLFVLPDQLRDAFEQGLAYAIDIVDHRLVLKLIAEIPNQGVDHGAAGTSVEVFDHAVHLPHQGARAPLNPLKLTAQLLMFALEGLVTTFGERSLGDHFLQSGHRLRLPVDDGENIVLNHRPALHFDYRE